MKELLLAICIITFSISAISQDSTTKISKQPEIKNSSISYFRRTDTKMTSFKWMVYNPETNKETQFLRLPQKPIDAFWTKDYSKVYYIMENTIYVADWKKRAEPQKLVEIKGSLADNFLRLWADDKGVLNIAEMVFDDKLKVTRFKKKNDSNGGFYIYKGKKFPSDGRPYIGGPMLIAIWQLQNNKLILADGVISECEACETLCEKALDEPEKKYSFRYSTEEPYTYLDEHNLEYDVISRDEYNEPSLVYIRSRVSENIGFKATLTEAMSNNAYKTPFYIVEKTANGKFKTLYKKGRINKENEEQENIQFIENGRYALIFHTFSEKGVLFDLKNKKLNIRFPPLSYNYMWVAPLN